MIPKIIRKFTSSQFYSKNLYEVLGLQQNAGTKDIKTSYYNLAMTYHPDKNKNPSASEIFAKICQAYEVLSDENKKKLYDACGAGLDDSSSNRAGRQTRNARTANGTASSAGADNSRYGQQRKRFQEEVFQDFDQFFNAKSKERARPPLRGSDIQLLHQVSFEDGIRGLKDFKISYERKVICPGCHGKRTHKGHQAERCYACGGGGFVSIRGQFETVKSVCDNCDGWGQIVREHCKECDAKGHITRQCNQKFDLPECVQDGQVFRLEKKGNCGEQGGENGDLFVKVALLKHAKFARDGKNIYSEEHIDVLTAILGGKREVEVLGGQKVPLNITNGTQHGSVIKLANLGVKLEGQRFQGDHFVQIFVQIPTAEQINIREREVWKKLLALEKEMSASTQSKQQQFTADKSKQQEQSRQNQ